MTSQEMELAKALFQSDTHLLTSDEERFISNIIWSNRDLNEEDTQKLQDLTERVFGYGREG